LILLIDKYKNWQADANVINFGCVMHFCAGGFLKAKTIKTGVTGLLAGD